MDCTTPQHAKNELADRLIQLGNRLDVEKDPETMRLLLRQRKQDQAAMAALRAVTALSHRPFPRPRDSRPTAARPD